MLLVLNSTVTYPGPPFFFEEGGEEAGNVVYCDLSRWDRFRVRLGPGHGIVFRDVFQKRRGGVMGRHRLLKKTDHLLERVYSNPSY